MTKTLFRVIATDVIGARNLNQPDLGLQEGVLYDVVADVKAAVTARVPDGTSSGYLVRNAETGVVLPQIYRRDRFVKENEQLEAAAPAQASEAASAAPASDGEHFAPGDVVVCVDADGARSLSNPETMLEQDEEYRILADVTDAVTARNPEGGSSGYVVQRTDDDAVLAGIWRRSRFERA